ncbi:MAG: hypothetical protein GY703_22380, partial [Gammaproteobacteria bacterium]|nr:hypothetical protein [Gammaproteobacteria bacterium]
MTEISRELLDSVHTTGACMVDIRELAGNLSQLSTKQIDQLLLNFVDNGEDRAVSRLLQACAYNEVPLDPRVLCRCIGVCEETPDSAPCFALQDGSAVPPLLSASLSKELSMERKIYATSLATELTLKFSLDPQPVRKVIWKHEQGALSPYDRVLIAHLLELLDKDSNPVQPYTPLWTGFQLSDLLPEHRPRVAVGGDYTVRRPIPKIGR